ncbi:MAG: hypothetical protein J5507_00630 [Clostridia bacterium]|nr:hypothetical protein [Clostridia bacterium]
MTKNVSKIITGFFESIEPIIPGTNYFILKTSPYGSVCLRRYVFNGDSYVILALCKDALEKNNFESTLQKVKKEMTRFKEDGQKKLDPLYCECPWWMPVNN